MLQTMAYCFDSLRNFVTNELTEDVRDEACTKINREHKGKKIEDDCTTGGEMRVG